MTEPRRLIDGGEADAGGDGASTPMEMSLLRAARSFTPSEASKAKTLAALGLAIGAAGGAGLAAGGAAAAAKTVASKGLGGWLFGTAIGKIVLSATCVLALGAGVLAARARGPERATSASPAAASPAASTAASDPAVTTTEGRPPLASASTTIAPALAPTTTAPPSTSAPLTSATTPPTPSAKPDLAGESALLDRARSALGAGDPAGALRALDEHRKGYARPMLGIEAAVLRIDALERSGDHARAKTLGEAFLASHPDSPHAARVRTLIHADPPKPIASSDAAPIPGPRGE